MPLAAVLPLVVALPLLAVLSLAAVRPPLATVMLPFAAAFTAACAAAAAMPAWEVAVVAGASMAEAARGATE